LDLFSPSHRRKKSSEMPARNAHASLFQGDMDSADELISVDMSLLNDALLDLLSSCTIAALRRGVDCLKKELHDPASHLRTSASETDAARVSAVYVSGELDQIAESQTLDRASYYVKRLSKSLTEARVGDVNDINLNRWKEYTDIYVDSLWNIERRENSGAHSAEYWGNFIPQIPNQMMRRYTKRGEWVLDPFAGLGTTLIEGRRLGRNAIGVELQDGVVDKARQLIELEPNPDDVVSDMWAGDSATLDYTDVLSRHGRQSVQLAILHPPYFDIIKFSDDPRDLSRSSSLTEFLDGVGRIALKAAQVLDRGRYLVLVVGDKYAKGEWIPLGFLTMNRVLELGFVLKSIVVKNFDDTTGKRQKKELWRYRALAGGFYIFKHEYVFILRKR